VNTSLYASRAPAALRTPAPLAGPGLAIPGEPARRARHPPDVSLFPPRPCGRRSPPPAPDRPHPCTRMPPGARVALAYCRTADCTFSLLPHCLAAEPGVRSDYPLARHGR